MTKVLIAEDDDAIRSFLTEGFIGEGYVVAATKNGAEALEQCAIFSPDVVLLDLMMPIVNGFQFLERRGEQCAAPVICLSAAYHASQLPEGRGVVAFVAKPFDFRVLVRAVAQVASQAPEAAIEPES
jgi:two-component system, OmpR family, alkaline phosphatase synthesis response regulator PhoP